MRALGRTLGLLAGSVLRIRRAEVVARLRDSGIDEPERVASAMYGSLGVGLVELVSVALSGAPLRRVVLTDRAEEALDRARRGGVAATAHVGNWDLVACAIASRAPLAVVTKRLSIGALDRLWQGIRARRGVHLLDAKGSIRAALAAIDDGALVASIIDQAPSARSNAIVHPFLGRPAWHDVSAATLAARARKPLLVAFGRRMPDGTHVVDVPLVLEPPHRAARGWIEEATRVASDHLADFVRQHPEQWLWLHRRWKNVPERVLAPPHGAPAARVLRAVPMEDVLRLGAHTFRSRLFLGTGKYKDVAETRAALVASGAEVITVALRRVNLQERGEGSLMALLTDKARAWTLLPNTAGCHTAEEAVRTCRLARELGLSDLVKLEVIGDPKTLFPDNEATLEAAKVLVKEGFTVLPYCIDDPIVCRKLEDLGCAAVMPLAAPIGSGLGIRNPYNLMIILEQAKVPVIVDAGVGTASDAAVAMELGCDGVLMNTAVAGAKDPILMAEAMRDAVVAGRKAFRAGRIPKKLYATASSPEGGKIA